MNRFPSTALPKRHLACAAVSLFIVAVLVFAYASGHRALNSATRPIWRGGGRAGASTATGGGACPSSRDSTFMERTIGLEGVTPVVIPAGPGPVIFPAGSCPSSRAATTPAAASRNIRTLHAAVADARERTLRAVPDDTPARAALGVVVSTRAPAAAAAEDGDVEEERRRSRRGRRGGRNRRNRGGRGQPHPYPHAA